MLDSQEQGSARPVFELTASTRFASWLAALGSSLVFTTYQTAKVFFIGLQPSGRLSIFERTLERVMGLSASATTIHLSTLYQLWRFENVLAPRETFQGYDAVYTPRESRVTGELDIRGEAGRAMRRPLTLGDPAPEETCPEVGLDTTADRKGCESLQP